MYLLLATSGRGSAGSDVEGEGAAEEDAEGVGSDGGCPFSSSMYQTAVSYARLLQKLTLVVVVGRALVRLDAVVSLIEALVAAGDRDAVVVGEVPPVPSDQCSLGL